MEKTEIIKILNSAKPYYQEMDNIYQEIVSLDNQKTTCRKSMSAGQIILGTCLTLFLCMVPGIIYFCVKGSQIKKQNDQRVTALENQKQILLNKAQSIIGGLQKTGISNLYQSEIWTNPHDMNYIYSYFSSGRAETVKESLNLLAEDKHRDKMENMQAQMLDLQNKANQQLFWGNMINAGNAMQLSSINRKL